MTHTSFTIPMPRKREKGVGKGYVDQIRAFPLQPDVNDRNHAFAEIPSGAIFHSVCRHGSEIYLIAQVDSEQLCDLMNFQIVRFGDTMKPLAVGDRELIGVLPIGEHPSEQIAIYKI